MKLTRLLKPFTLGVALATGIAVSAVRAEQDQTAPSAPQPGMHQDGMKGMENGMTGDHAGMMNMMGMMQQMSQMMDHCNQMMESQKQAPDHQRQDHGHPG